MRRDEATAVCERTTHFEGTERELPETVRGVLDNALSNPAMKRHLGLSSSRAIRDMADFQRLPFMTKDFLRRSDRFELCCAEPREVVRVHSTSGTTGEAVIIPYTAADVRVFEMIVARSLMMAGVKPGDRVLVTPGFGLWTAGAGFQGGVEAVGVQVVLTQRAGEPDDQGGLPGSANRQVADDHDRHRQAQPPHQADARGQLAQRGRCAVDPAERRQQHTQRKPSVPDPLGPRGEAALQGPPPAVRAVACTPGEPRGISGHPRRRAERWQT